MRRLRDNLATIVVGLLVVALMGWAATVMISGANAGSRVPTALVHDADGGIRALPLDEDARVVVNTDLGSNTVVVRNGAVRMEEADCPNGDCTRQLPISRPGQQIICLPHKLWVEVVSEDGEGAAMDVDAVTWENSTVRDVDLVTR